MPVVLAPSSTPRMLRIVPHPHSATVAAIARTTPTAGLTMIVLLEAGRAGYSPAQRGQEWFPRGGCGCERRAGQGAGASAGAPWRRRGSAPRPGAAGLQLAEDLFHDHGIAQGRPPAPEAAFR